MASEESFSLGQTCSSWVQLGKCSVAVFRGSKIGQRDWTLESTGRPSINIGFKFLSFACILPLLGVHTISSRCNSIVYSLSMNCNSGIIIL